MGTKERFYIRKESNSHRIGLEHQYGRRFIVLEHQYGRHDVMWKRPIAICFNLLQVCASLLPFVFPVLFIPSFNSSNDYLFHSIWWQFPLFEFWLPSLSLYGVFPGLLGQCISVTYPRNVSETFPDHVIRNAYAAHNNEGQELGKNFGKRRETELLNPLNPKIKIWVLLCCLYPFPTEVVGRSW